MRVCMVSKFPPIEGGVASRTYWLANRLGKRGVSVDVVTNAAACEPEYSIEGCEQGLSSIDNVTVHDLKAQAPWHIPASANYLERISNCLLKVVRENEVDVIDSGYLVPYGIAGWLVSRTTGIPHVVRHGCCDISKFLNNPEYSELLACVVRDADIVISDPETARAMDTLGANVLVREEYVPDESAFSFRTTSRDTPVFAYVGKVNNQWHRRGLGEIAECFSSIPADTCPLVFTSQGRGIESFRKSIGRGADSRIEFSDFVPPWRMPEVLDSVDFIFDLSDDDPMFADSFVLREAAAMGVTVVTNRPSRRCHENHVVIDKLDTRVIDRLCSGPAAIKVTSHGDFERWVDTNIDIYSSLI